MVTIVILDDDAHSIAQIQPLVEQRMPHGVPYTILTAQSLADLDAIIAQGTQIDILISDIMLSDKRATGIDVVQGLFPPESGTQIIYVSGFLEQATEVYRTPHLYFLLKPLDPDKLQDALTKACAALSARRPPMLRIKSGYKERLLNATTITYLESVSHKIYVHTRTDTIETYAKLDDLQAQLPASFSRCHRSFLVNLAFVRSLEEGDVILHDGTTIPISRRRAKQVQHDLLSYLSA